tara:strand:+ start:647 stop:943 length:297 start_codon:yes stop_codon:yes gene_type:complete
MMHGSMRHTPCGRKKSYNAWSTKKKPTPEFQPMEVKSEPYRRPTGVYKSVDTGTHNTQKKERMTYTGTLIKGIGTMHKSNAVPVIDVQQMKDLSRMSR